MHTWDPNIWEIETEGWGVQGHPCQHSKVKGSFQYDTFQNKQLETLLSLSKLYYSGKC